MLFKIIFVTTTIIAILLCVYGGNSHTKEFKEFKEFNDFKLKYNKTYADANEESLRFNIFSCNMRIAKDLQEMNPYANFGTNEFSDMTAEEFKIRHNAEKYYGKHKNYSKFNKKLEYVNHSIDWRKLGAVTSVKNQGNCGSCYSFSAIQNIEGQWFLAGNDLVSLSEQEIVSCDGCNGGSMDNVFIWLVNERNGTVTSEENYPYVSGSGIVPECLLQNLDKTAAQICSYHDLPHDENIMALWVYKNGPLSIGVDATSWQNYLGGILTNCISQQVDHGVLIVGFNDTHQPPFWIIKNSWGNGWGEAGYIRVAKGSNQCLITTAPSSSVVC